LVGAPHLLALLISAGSAVVLAIAVLQQQRRIKQLHARISDAARADPLTGLLNRRALDELLDLELERARRTGRPVSLVIGELDGLRATGEREGEKAGDRALELVARDLEKWKRRIDRAARIGAEEFAVLLPETEQGGAYLVAERLRRAAHRTFSDASASVTISFGVASHPDHGDDGAGLFRAADQAVHAAKDLGRDRTIVYSAELTRLLAATGRGGGSEELQLATLIALAEAIDIRDTGTTKHSNTVARYARMMAMELGLDAGRVERVRLAGVLHDVGKVGIPDGVLSKPGPLDEREWREMRTHPEVAARLLSRRELEDVRTWILAHHERPDGSGYPLGLSASSIPLEASILAVADAYEAMTADRVYRPALGREAARAELEAGAGIQFDADVVRAFLGALDREHEQTVRPAHIRAV
jgi:diguanylate cyclase (GGDEF)-like protein/putative nucleotidyltransferase with HDIG domain